MVFPSEMARVRYLFNQFQISRSEYPKPFYADVLVAKRPVIDVTESTECNRLGGTE